MYSECKALVSRRARVRGATHSCPRSAATPASPGQPRVCLGNTLFLSAWWLLHLLGWKLFTARLGDLPQLCGSEARRSDKDPMMDPDVALLTPPVGLSQLVRQQQSSSLAPADPWAVEAPCKGDLSLLVFDMGQALEKHYHILSHGTLKTTPVLVLSSRRGNVRL